MTDSEQKDFEKFVYLSKVEQFTYKKIEENGIQTTKIREYEKTYASKGDFVKPIRDLYNRKKIKADGISFADFYKWYIEKQQKMCCCYCGIKEEQIGKVISDELFKKLWGGRRGKKLELERKIHDEKYSNIDNLDFACTWCNNAKTNTFTCQEFKEIAKGINTVWNLRLGGKGFNDVIKFPNNVC